MFETPQGKCEWYLASFEGQCSDSKASVIRKTLIWAWLIQRAYVYWSDSKDYRECQGLGWVLCFGYDDETSLLNLL
jgi:hypothetical protein